MAEEETSVASTWVWLDSKRERERLMGGCDCFCSCVLWSSPLKLQNEHENLSTAVSLLSFSLSIVRVSQVKCSHSYVTSVVWLWHLALTKGILTFILPMNPNSHTAKIWSGLSKCRNISGIPEEICSGPRFNQEKAAELAQICHHKNVFLEPNLALRSTHSFTRYTFTDEGIKLPGLVN